MLRADGEEPVAQHCSHGRLGPCCVPLLGDLGAGGEILKDEVGGDLKQKLNGQVSNP